MHVASNSYLSYLRGHCDLQTTLEVPFDLKIVLSSHNHPEFYVHATSNSYFGSLRGHCDLQTTSEVTSDLKYEFSGLNNLHYSVILASKNDRIWQLWPL